MSTIRRVHACLASSCSRYTFHSMPTMLSQPGGFSKSELVWDSVVDTSAHLAGFLVVHSHLRLLTGGSSKILNPKSGLV